MSKFKSNFMHQQLKTQIYHFIAKQVAKGFYHSAKNAKNFMIKSLISWWIAILNLKLPIFVFWVRSFIFAALDINRFMTGQIWLKAQAIQRQTPINSQLYNGTNLTWSTKTRPFLAHAVLFIFIISATPNPVANVTNEYLQNAFKLI